MDVHPCELDRAFGLERKPAGEQAVEDDAEGVDVARRCRRLCLSLLGREVRRCAEQRARLRQRAGAAQAGDPEVRDLSPPLLVEQNVRRLQIPVDEPARVCVSEAGGQLPRELLRLVVQVRLAGSDLLLECPARQVLQHHERSSGFLAVVVETADVRVGERRDGMCLAVEPGRIGVAAEKLQCDATAELGVVGEPDFGHAPAPEERVEPVAARHQFVCHAASLCGPWRVSCRSARRSS